MQTAATRPTFGQARLTERPIGTLILLMEV